MRLTTVWALLAIVTAPACEPSSQPPARRPIPVRVRAVAEAAAGTHLRYSGTIEPAARVDMAFRVGGYVEYIGEIAEAGRHRPLEKGDPVAKGTVLARVRAGDHAQRVATANAAINEARSALKLAELELERSRRLYEDRAVPKAELDVRVAQHEAARAAVEGAIARAREASVSLGDTTLTAPMDGTVLARHVEVGTLVAPGAPAFVIADMRSVKAVFGAPQSLVEKLRVGSPLWVYVSAEGEGGPGQDVVDAKVSRIAPAAEASGRVFSVEATLPNPSGKLRPGSVVSVHVPEAALASAAIVVPLSAIVRSPRDPRGFSVFILEGDGPYATARIKDVHLGEVLGNDVTVSGGLAVGNRVVTVGATLLRDGQPAVVIPGR